MPADLTRVHLKGHEIVRGSSLGLPERHRRYVELITATPDMFPGFSDKPTPTGPMMKGSPCRMLSNAMKWIQLFALFLSASPLGTRAYAAAPLILREPTLSRDAIVFVFADDLWRVPRSGGDAVRLTTHPAQERLPAGTSLYVSRLGLTRHPARLPAFSPDGSRIAFTAEYDGNTDVYVMPAGGGIPVRLTSHPAEDLVAGWTPDGQRVLFSSDRAVPTDGARLYTVSAAGGPAAELPLPIALAGSFSADGSHLAYVPTPEAQAAWKRYRGGQARRIWVADLADSSIQSLPHGDASEFNPVWIGDTIYFLSDRNGPVTLFAYDLQTKRTRCCIENSGLDIKSASAGPGAIVFGQFDAIRLYDLASGKVTTVDVRLTGDWAEVQPHHKNVRAKDLMHPDLSPTGQQAVFETHGEIVTVPARNGRPRNLTQTPGIAERDPAWSPDGKWIAYFSDESGEYDLHLRAPGGQGKVRKIRLGDPPSFYYHPIWSPDSQHIAYADKRGNLWLLNVAQGASVLVDTQPFMVGYGPDPGPDSWSADPDPGAYSWSPDSRWLAYSSTLKNHLSAIFIYSLESGRTRQVTDGLSDAQFSKFSDNGQYLYFAASTDSAAVSSWTVESGVNQPVTYSLYLAVLDRTAPSPLAPESDEEKSRANQGRAGAKDGREVKIDFDNLSQRILALPMEARNYEGLFPGKSGAFFVLEGPTVDPAYGEGPPECTVWKLASPKSEAERFADNVKAFVLAGNREKVLFQKGDDWFLTGADKPPKEGDGRLKLDGFRIAVNPRAEWRQMYHEAWRLERDFFYDPGHHGLDLQAAEARYQVYLEGLACRSDLNLLFEEMLGELTAGHLYITGGDLPEVKPVNVGLLGADYSVEHGRYRFSRIYNRENWNPDLRAPLAEPGLNVVAGDYLLAVDGRDLPGTAELYAFFQDRADKLVTLRVGPDPGGAGARDVKVKPVNNEQDLRNRAWVEDNRRTVDRLSSNRLAYVYLPDTSVAGYRAFNRYYFAQIEKQGFIIDERFSAGGSFSDYIVDWLHRQVLINIANREGADYSLPVGASAGPKVMLINEFAGSGGDALPWFFRKLGIGPLVGRRTWGGVGVLNYHPLMDGGKVAAPDSCAYGTQGQWEVENKGISPDFEVELDPEAWRAGRDLQLEKAVQVALESLARHPPVPSKRPPYPNYHPKPVKEQGVGQ
jgi:tricorn protease